MAGSDHQFVWASIAQIYGIPGVPEWAGWFADDLKADARWTGQLLSQLTRQQIRQAFQAAGYSPEEVEQFTSVVEERINELNRL